MGTYCNETDVEGITQFDINATTNPNTTEVGTWITKVEADVDARGLGSYTLTDQYVDVAPQIGYPPRGSIAWLRSIATGRYDTIRIKNIIVLPFLPIISIVSLSRRTSGLGSTDVWEALTEGRESSNSYIIMKKRSKTNQYLGYGLQFHNNIPDAGLERIKVTYNYGWNLSTDIIGEWCSLKVAIKVLDAIIAATTPIGSGDYGVDTVRIGLDPARRRVEVKERILELENQYFPAKKLGIAII